MFLLSCHVMDLSSLTKASADFIKFVEALQVSLLFLMIYASTRHA